MFLVPFYVPWINSLNSPAIFNVVLLLFLGCGFLRRLFRSSFPGYPSFGGLRLRLRLVLFSRRRLAQFRLLLGQRRRLEALPVKSNLGNAHGGKRLPVPAQLLVLLLPLVMKNQDFRAATFFHHFANHARWRFRFADLSFAPRHRQHVREVHVAVGSRSQLLHSNHVSGRHPVLLSTGADDRVHTSASVENVVKSVQQARFPRTQMPPWHPLNFLRLLCFRHGASAAKAGAPRTGRRVQANSTILACAVEIGQSYAFQFSCDVREFRRPLDRYRVARAMNWKGSPI